jgi:hypothetical protein
MRRVSITPMAVQLRSVLEDGITFIEDQLQSLGLGHLIANGTRGISRPQSHSRIRALQLAGNANRAAAIVLEVCGFMDLVQLDSRINARPPRQGPHKMTSQKRWAS